MNVTQKRTFAIVISFIAAFVLTVLPLSAEAEAWRPLWVVVVVIFWCLFAPHKVGVVVAFGIGLLVDVMLGTLLGQQGLLLVVIAYAVYCLRDLMALYPMQLLLLPLFIMIYQLLEMIIERAYSGWPISISAFEWRVVISSMLLWLLLLVLFKRSLK